MVLAMAVFIRKPGTTTRRNMFSEWFFIDNALMWLRDYHCDALRLDAVHAIFDGSARHRLGLAASAKEREAERRWQPCAPHP